MKILAAHHLVKRYNQRTVVKEVSFDVAAGEIVGLLGPNGAGKTTSFNMVAGLIRPEHGRVTLNGQDITALPLYRRARLGIGYLPQEASVFRNLSVYDNFMAVLEYVEPLRAQRRPRAEALLEEFGLTHVRNNSGARLSGGERRRTEIARALICNPTHLLFDEPFAGIDPIAVKDLQNLVISLKQRGIGILITDHNVRETLTIVDRAYIINEGTLLESGTPATLANSPLARKIYLGETFTLERP